MDQDKTIWRGGQEKEKKKKKDNKTTIFIFTELKESKSISKYSSAE